MGDRSDLHSPLRRAQIGVRSWLDLLPKEVQSSAEMALDRLREVAEKEIEQAYFDGNNHRRDAQEANELRRKLAGPTPVSNG